MVISRSSQSRLDIPFQGSGNSLRLSIFSRWIEGVGLPPPCSPFYETLQASILSHLPSSYPWITPGRHLDICRDRLLGGSSAWISRKGKKRPGQPRTPTHIHQSLILFLLFLLRGTLSNHHRSRWGCSHKNGIMNLKFSRTEVDERLLDVNVEVVGRHTA